MKSKFRVHPVAILLAACVLIVGMRLEAHHSFGAEYDAEKPVTLKGVITRIEWANPHCHIYLDIKEARVQSRTGSLKAILRMSFRVPASRKM